MKSEREEFAIELKALLEKYNATISAGDHWTGYAECGQDVRITIEFGDWSVNDIDAGSCIYPDSELNKDAET